MVSVGTSSRDLGRGRTTSPVSLDGHHAGLGMQTENFLDISKATAIVEPSSGWVEIRAEDREGMSSYANLFFSFLLA